MKIETMQLQDFKCFQDMEIDFTQPVNLIFGENASGKSSIAQAILFGLVGSSNGYEKNALIRHNAQDFAISLSLCDGSGIPSKITRSASANTTAETKAILQRLKTNKDILAALLKTTNFLELHPDEKKKILFDLLPDHKVSPDNMADHLASWLKAHPEIPKQYHVVPDSNLMEALSSPVSLEEAYNEAYEVRRITRREQKGLGEAPRLPGNLTEETIEEDLRQKQQDLSRLYIAIGETKGMAAGEKKQLERDLKQTSEEINQLKARAAGAKETDEGMYDRQLEELLERKAVLARELAQLREEDTALIGEIQKLQEEWHRGAIERARIKTFDGHCPLFPDVICETGEIARLAKAAPSGGEELENAIKRLAEEQSQTASLLKMKTRMITSMDADIAAIRQDIQTAQRRTTEEKNRLRELEALKEKLEGVLSTVAEDKTTEAEKLTRDISTLEEDIRRKKETQAALKKARQIRSLEERVNRMEVLTLAFSPKGIMSDIMKSATTDLMGMANNLLADLAGDRYAIELDMQEGFQILLHDLQRQTTTDIGMASASERFRVGIVLQAVLSRLAGLRFMVIDGIDILDQANKGFFFDFLQKAAPQFDQIIALGAIGPVAPRNPGIPGIDFFIIEDGRITRI